MSIVKNEKIFFYTSPVEESDFTEEKVKRLLYEEIENVIEVPQIGLTDNFATQTPVNRVMATANKSDVDTSSSTLVVEYVGAYEGQEALSKMAATNYSYIMARQLTDAMDAKTANSVWYSLVKVTGPTQAGGDITTFANDTFTIQPTSRKPFRVRGVAGAAPINVAVPTISGAATVGETLSVDVGTWSGSEPLTVDDWTDIGGEEVTDTFAYQWLADGKAIEGATDSAYTLTSDEEGAAITVEVTCSCRFGSTTVVSDATDAVSVA